jgi:predicted nucleotidyltransferase
MIPLIADNKDAIAALCREFRIRKLDLFGSAATGEFDPDTSDVDFIVDLGGYDETVVERFFGLIWALEELLGRHVDVITEAQIKNPYFRDAVEEQRTPLYEAGDRQAVA